MVSHSEGVNVGAEGCVGIFVCHRFFSCMMSKMDRRILTEKSGYRILIFLQSYCKYFKFLDIKPNSYSPRVFPII